MKQLAHNKIYLKKKKQKDYFAKQEETSKPSNVLTHKITGEEYTT